MINWLNRKLAGGIYEGPARRVIEWCYDHLSLNDCLHRTVKRRLGLCNNENSPPWVSELYQIVALLVGVALVTLSRYLLPPCRWVPGFFALYRPFEILLFSTRWVFIQTAPVLSYKRSLAGFLINLGEVVVAFAAAFLSFGCAQGIPTALYSSLRTLVTIGPLSTAEPPVYPACGVLITGEILVAYLLGAIIVASVVAAIKPRPQGVNGPTPSS